jgi:digeranylgeranylglycerophospholipid reductase
VRVLEDLWSSKIKDFWHAKIEDFSTAKTCAKYGLDTVLVEKKEDFKCVKFAQVVDSNIWDFIKFNSKFVNREIKGIRIIAPDGTEIETSSKEFPLYSLDRQIFDGELVKLAIKVGAEYINKTRATGLIREEEEIKGIKAKVNEKEDVEIRSNIVIGADSIESKIARWSGIRNNWKIEDLDPCAEAIIAPVDNLDPYLCQYFWGDNKVPFGEVRSTPIGDETFAVTAEIFSNLAEKSPKYYLIRYLKKEGYLTKVIDKSASAFPLALSRHISGDNVILVGDTAGQGSSSWGGGILHAMNAGIMAGENAVEAHEERDFSYDLLSRYEKRWYRYRGRRDTIVRKVLRGMMPVFWHDKNLNKFVRLLKEADCVYTDKLIQRFGSEILTQNFMLKVRSKMLKELSMDEWVEAGSHYRKYNKVFWDEFMA